MVRATKDLTSGVFKRLEITSSIDVDKIVNCTEGLLIVSVLKNIKRF